MRQLSRRQKNNLIIGGLCCVLVLMGIGYAAFSSQLKINGTSSISSSWNVLITDITSGSIVGGASNASEPTHTNTTATFSTSLVSPGDSITYTITVENTGNVILNNIEVDIDDTIFISLKELNELRRELVTKLINKRIENKKEIIINEIPKIEDNVKTNNANINVLVRNEEQLLACLNKVDNVYTDDYNLYLKYKSNNIYYRTSRAMSSFNEFKNENILASELGSAYKYSKNNNVVSDYFLNVVNDYSIKFLKELGIKRVVISSECDFNKIKLLKDKDIEVIIYGKMELMIMKYCPLKELLNNCSVCKNNKNKYYLQDRLGYKYRIIHNNCLTHIMHYKNIDYISNIHEYINMGITNYRIELLDESKEEVLNIINSIKSMI